MGQKFKCSNCGTTIGTVAFVKPAYKCTKCGFMYCGQCASGNKAFKPIFSGLKCMRCGGKITKL